MTTWRTGETRRGAYERAQFVMARVSRDLAAIYPHNPPLARPWIFQVDSLFSANADGAGEDAVTYATPQNMSRVELGTPYLQLANPQDEGRIEYRIDLPFVPATAIVEPKITLVAADDRETTCHVVIEAAVDDNIETGTFTEIERFAGGVRGQVITPSVDISSVARSATDRLAVRIRIAPEPGKQSTARLFEAARDDPLRPVFRLALSPERAVTGLELRAGFRPDGSQWVLFTRSNDDLHGVAYFTLERVLYRVQTSAGTGGTDGLDDVALIEQRLRDGDAVPYAEPVANGIAYFGCEFQNQYRHSDDPEENEERRQAAMQLYWNEADSVPPYVKMVVAAVPLSGAVATTTLDGDIDEAAATIPVQNTTPFQEGRAINQFVRIDDEWIRYERLGDGRLLACERGQRGTLPAPHDSGSAVTAAETFQVSLPVPAWGYRDR
jgi:hypothetical protein